MRFLPIGLDLAGRPCLVAGGGGVGTRKVRSLLEAGAEVLVVAPLVKDELRALVQEGRVRWLPEPLSAHHLDGAFLAVAASDDEAANDLLVEEARSRGILFCDATSAERTEVSFGALHRGDGYTVAVFTDGRDPARARQVRDEIADFLSKERKTDLG